MTTAAQAVTTTKAVTQAVTTTTQVVTATTAPSRPVTTALLPGDTRLENGHLQNVGIILQAAGIEFLAGNGPFTIDFVPSETLTDEEREAAARGEINIALNDPREVGYQISPTATITVSTLGDGGQQAITLEQFLSLWTLFSPEGGEHLTAAFWSIERDENAMVLSITERPLR